MIRPSGSFLVVLEEAKYLVVVPEQVMINSWSWSRLYREFGGCEGIGLAQPS